MIKIIEAKSEIKKYTDALNAFFKMYNLSDKKESLMQKYPEMEKVVNMVESGEMYGRDPAKKELFISNFLGDGSVESIAERLNFSRSYLYTLKQEMMKEIAMLVFDVIIV